MITTIRPNKLFALVPEEDRIAQVRIPKRVHPDVPDYSLTLLETFCLIACLKLTKARKVFEFGTFMGATTINLAMNTEPDAMVFTLDLPPWLRLTDHPRQQDHQAIAFRQKYWMMAADHDDRDIGIQYIRCDSRAFDFEPFYRATNLIWIDGGRDWDTVVSDAANAFRMLNPRRLGVIGWHDFRHPECGELTEFLERLSEEVPLYHIGDTNMVLFFNRPMRFA